MSPRKRASRLVDRPRPGSHAPGDGWSTALRAAALAALVLAAYWPIFHAGYIWDDDSYVTGNAALRSLDGLRRIWFQIGAVPQYYPLVFSTFWVEYHLWGLAPLGYHLVNVLLHMASVLLLWRLLTRLRVPGAWLAAALFAVHPVMVESAGWVTERKNVLSLALALGSLLSYLRFSPFEGEGTGDDARSIGAQRAWRWYALSLALFVAALLSKTVVASLPGVILVITWWKCGRITRRDVARLAPFFLIGIGGGLLTAWMEKHFVGAAGFEWNYSPIERVLIAGRAVWFYAAKLVWPYPLAFFYPRFTIDDRVWWQYLFPLAAVALLAVLWMARGRVGRGPLAAALIFGGVLVPALGFVDVYPMRFSFVADHFQYHASAALLTLAAAAATKIYSKLPSGQRPLALGAMAIVIAGLAMLTYQRSVVFHDVEHLYRDTIAKNPAGPTAYANLAVHLESVGQYEEALRLAREAVRLDAREATAHNTLGICLIRLASTSIDPEAQRSAGIAEFKTALDLLPNYADAYVNLGTTLSGLGRLDEARHSLEAALALNPQHAEAHNTLGNLDFSQRNFRQAAEHYEAAVAARPDFGRAWNNLGVCSMNLDQTDRAIDCFREAVRQDPHYQEARSNLARAEQLRQSRAQP
jgi:tetratricopeptide (TPR) repeat protein